jgi:D-cysteine desulfhydrase family pyridoxal phosphate-dependent enzyme
MLEQWPRLRYAVAPTPIQPLSALSRQLGTHVYCKRDDLNGFGFGGNKLRKLEFLVQEALCQGCDTLITCGSNQSNWCRMTAAVAAANGLEVHLVLGGGEPERVTGNLLLDRLLGAHLHHLPTTSDPELEAGASQLADELRARNKRPYHMIMGGSTGLGVLGYVAALAEILEQEAALGLHFDAIVHATGSGGTQAGLIVGQTLSGWNGRIIGVSVSRPADAQRLKVRRVLDQAEALLSCDFTAAEIIVRDEYAGPGYRQNTPEAQAAIELFARAEGLFLDQVYTGKAAAGLIDMARRGEFSREQSILFVHTGGNVQLFE